LTNGRRSRCASGETARGGDAKRRPTLDVHDVKQPDAGTASCHAVARAPARARDSGVDETDVDETEFAGADFEGLVSALRTMRSLLPLRRRGQPAAS
jgi:hypothetical protein